MKNPELNLAWQFVKNTGTHVFLTGKAGTGKTTFLRTLKAQLPKRMIVLAPTGIAAINAGGVTIHSFFQLPFSPYIPNTTFRAEGTFRFGREKQRIIRTIESGTCVVLVTHDAQEAVRLAQHIYCLGGKPAGIFAEIHLPEAFQQRDHAWCQEKSAHPALRGIEEAALAD